MSTCRTRKWRDKQKLTKEGIDQLKAQNRLYAQRSRKKKRTRALLDESQKMKDAKLNSVEVEEINANVVRYRAEQKHAIAYRKVKDNKGDSHVYLDLDEGVELDFQVAKFEAESVRRVIKKREFAAKRLLEFSTHPTVPPPPATKKVRVEQQPQQQQQQQLAADSPREKAKKLLSIGNCGLEDGEEETPLQRARRLISSISPKVGPVP